MYIVAQPLHEPQSLRESIERCEIMLSYMLNKQLLDLFLCNEYIIHRLLWNYMISVCDHPAVGFI